MESDTDDLGVLLMGAPEADDDDESSDFDEYAKLAFDDSVDMQDRMSALKSAIKACMSEYSE